VKLHVEGDDVAHRVTGYGEGWIEVDRVRYDGSIVLMVGHRVEPWAVDGFDSLAAEHFDGLIALAPDVVLLGTGERLRFPHPRLVAGLAAVHIGVDAMDTAAACRTYNVLAAEGRRVVALLLS
jgi:uncharacterized protein